MSTATVTRIPWGWIRQQPQGLSDAHAFHVLKSFDGVPSVKRVIALFEGARELQALQDEKRIFERDSTYTTADVIAQLRQQDEKRLEAWRQKCNQIAQEYCSVNAEILGKGFERLDRLDRMPIPAFPDRPNVAFEKISDEDLAAAIAPFAHGNQIPKAQRDAALAKFDAQMQKVSSRHADLTPAEWLAAVGLVFFNSASIAGYADAAGRATDSADVKEFCEALGIERARSEFQPQWYKPTSLVNVRALAEVLGRENLGVSNA